ncbi:MAG: hypothetical protein ACTSW4_03425 [Candidatus Ranarchaeia archaeon]
METQDESSRGQRRRLPSVETTINEIMENPRMFSRVRLTGMVVSSDESLRELLLNDGTGTIRVFSNDIVSPKTLVRIIGRVTPMTDNEVELDAEIVQSLNIDPKLLKAVRDLRLKLQRKYKKDHYSPKSN